MNSQLFLQRYSNGVPFDVSGNALHGTATQLSPGAGEYDGFAMFTQPGSGVRVPQCPPLDNLFAVRAGVRFAWMPSAAGAARRHNLIEGHLSYSLHVLPDGTVAATILDATGAWAGVASPPGSIRRDEIVDVSLYHDGYSHMGLQIGDAIVTERFDVAGPVRSVGEYGVAIGRWPDPSDQYTLEGAIFESFLYKFDVRRWLQEQLLPDKQANPLLERVQELAAKQGTPYVESRQLSELLAEDESRAARDRKPDPLVELHRLVGERKIDLGSVAEISRRLRSVTQQMLADASSRGASARDIVARAEQVARGAQGGTLQAADLNALRDALEPAGADHGADLTRAVANLVGALPLELADFQVLAAAVGSATERLNAPEAPRALSFIRAWAELFRTT